MELLLHVLQASSIIIACWVAILGINAWRKEFIGKRRIELAETTLAKFYEVSDAIAFIRNPFSSIEEGKTREREPNEKDDESKLLDRAYIVAERYHTKEAVFVEFNTLKYNFMASFGPATEEIFVKTDQILKSIFISARMLGSYYWQRQGRVQMEPEEFQKHLEEMHKHEGRFWDLHTEDDEIRKELKDILTILESVTKPVFQEKMGIFYHFLSWSVFRKLTKQM